MSDSVRPHRRQPTRLPRPWDSPGKNTGVGCYFLLQCMKVKSESEVAQSCPTLVTPWTAAHQAPLSMGFSRQEYWSGVPSPSRNHPLYWNHNPLAPLFFWVLFYLSFLNLHSHLCAPLLSDWDSIVHDSVLSLGRGRGPTGWRCPWTPVFLCIPSSTFLAHSLSLPRTPFSCLFMICSPFICFSV